MKSDNKKNQLLKAGLNFNWWREQDLNLRPSGYEPDELPGCSIPRHGFFYSLWSGKPGSNWRHSAWKADALPTELFPHFQRQK